MVNTWKRRLATNGNRLNPKPTAYPVECGRKVLDAVAGGDLWVLPAEEVLFGEQAVRHGFVVVRVLLRASDHADDAHVVDALDATLQQVLRVRARVHDVELGEDHQGALA